MTLLELKETGCKTSGKDHVNVNAENPSVDFFTFSMIKTLRYTLAEGTASPTKAAKHPFCLYQNRE